MTDDTKTPSPSSAKPVPLKPRRNSFLGVAAAVKPPTSEPANNMKDEALAPMTFNMPKDWHGRFKATASINHISMKDLLIEAFEAWEKANPGRSLFR